MLDNDKLQSNANALLFMAQNRVEFEVWVKENKPLCDLIRNSENNYTDYWANLFYNCWLTAVNIGIVYAIQSIKEKGLRRE